MNLDQHEEEQMMIEIFFLSLFLVDCLFKAKYLFVCQPGSGVIAVDE